MQRAHRPLLIALALLGILSGSRPAHAWPYYFEFGGTSASLTTPSPLFQSQGKAASTSATSSYGVPMTLGLQLQERQGGILASIALQMRYLSGTSGAGDSYTSIPISPMLRLEFWRLVVGAAYTPLVYQSITFKRDGWITSVMTLEGQFLFPITPEIDFGLQAARTSYKSTSFGDGPTVMEYGAFFRLNFGMSEAAVGERRKFKGWRYPLGSPLR